MVQYLKNGWAQPFEKLKIHFIAVLKENEKKVREKDQKLVPVAICDPFSTDIVPRERRSETF